MHNVAFNMQAEDTTALCNFTASTQMFTKLTDTRSSNEVTEGGGKKKKRKKKRTGKWKRIKG